MRPRGGGGALAGKDEHEGLATCRQGHARGGDEARTGKDTALRSGKDNDEEAGVTRMTSKGGGAPACEDGKGGGGRRFKGG
jgi:hypothetical protein